MRTAVTIAVIAVLLTPTLATAQRGRGGYGQELPSFADKDGARAAPTGRDFEKRSVVHVLLDSKKKLSLSAEQAAKFDAAAAELTTQHAPIYTRVDSLQKVMRDANGSNVTDDQRQHALGARVAMADVADQMRSADEHATGVLLALLTDEQKEKANKLLEEQREAMRGGPRGGRRP